MTNIDTTEIEKVVRFPEPVIGIRIVSQDDFVAEYKKIGKTIPPFIVGVPYFELNGVGYFVFPIFEKRIPKFLKNQRKVQ